MASQERALGWTAALLSPFKLSIPLTAHQSSTIVVGNGAFAMNRTAYTQRDDGW